MSVPAPVVIPVLRNQKTIVNNAEYSIYESVLQSGQFAAQKHLNFASGVANLHLMGQKKLFYWNNSCHSIPTTLSCMSALAQNGCGGSRWVQHSSHYHLALMAGGHKLRKAL